MSFCNVGVPFLGLFLHRVMVIVWVNVDQIIPISPIVSAVNALRNMVSKVCCRVLASGVRLFGGMFRGCVLGYVSGVCFAKVKLPSLTRME